MTASTSCVISSAQTCFIPGIRVDQAWATLGLEQLLLGGLDTQVAFDNQMHELKLLMAADEKLWQLRGSVASIAAGAAATQGPQGESSSPISLQEPDWTAQQVTQCLPRHMHHSCDSGSRPQRMHPHGAHVV